MQKRGFFYILFTILEVHFKFEVGEDTVLLVKMLLVRISWKFIFFDNIKLYVLIKL